MVSLPTSSWTAVPRPLRALAVALSLLGVGSAGACGGPPTLTKPDTRAIVSLQCDVSDAEVWIDGRYFREVAELSKAFRLRAGEHRLEVRHDNYHSMYYELSILPGSRHTLRVELARKLP